MKKFRFLIICTLLLLVIAGCTDFVTDSIELNQNDELTLKSEKVPVPFSAEFSVWVNTPPAPVDGVMEQVEFGISNAPHPTHLGISQLYNEETIYLSAPPFTVPWIAVAHVVLTAANGDQLFINLNYEINATAFPQLVVNGTGAFNGGTGRFEDASGNLDFSADFDVSIMKGTQYYSGEIQY